MLYDQKIVFSTNASSLWVLVVASAARRLLQNQTTKYKMVGGFWTFSEGETNENVQTVGLELG